MDTVTKAVRVRLMIGGIETDGLVGSGYYDRENGERVEIFGLLRNETSFTHMSYNVSDWDALAFLERAAMYGWFWLDAGQTCKEVKISFNELRRAFLELHLIEDDRCDCIPESAPDGAQHTKDSHRDDCESSLCASCSRCIADQYMYYFRNGQS